MGSAIQQLIAQQQGPNILGAIGGAAQTMAALQQAKLAPLQYQQEQQRLDMGKAQLAQIGQQQEQQKRAQLLQLGANTALAIEKAPPEQHAQIYAQARDQAGKMGYDINQLPTEYGDEAKRVLDWSKQQVYGSEIQKTDESIRADKAKIDAQKTAPMTQVEQAKLTEEQRHNRQTESIGQQGLDLKKQEANPFGAGTAGGNPNGPKGEDYLATLPGPVAAQVKALAEGRMAFPGGFALKSPYWQQMISAVSQYDPSFDAVNYNARQKTRNDFTSGKSATSINALNTVIGHLQTLSDAADGLNNSSIPGVNKLTNFLASNTGDPRVKVFNTAKKAVVDELTRAYRGTGGSEADIKSWAENIDAANSPEQLHSVIAQMGHLLESKVTALGEQYNQGMGTTANPIQLVTPHARGVLTKLEQRMGDEQAAQTQLPAQNAKGWTLHQDAQGNKAYVSPDGKQYEDAQ